MARLVETENLALPTTMKSQERERKKTKTETSGHWQSMYEYVVLYTSETKFFTDNYRVINRVDCRLGSNDLYNLVRTTNTKARGTVHIFCKRVSEPAPQGSRKGAQRLVYRR